MDHWTENYREEENNLPVTVTAESTLFCTVASLQDPAMIVYDVATKFLETEIFPQERERERERLNLGNH